MLRRLPLTVALVAVLAVAAGCGNKKDVTTHGETEGIYLDVGPLKYQVQISRQLNPYNIEDKAYLIGLRVHDRVLPADSVWFAVFIRVENETDETQIPAADYTIEDTEGTEFRPLTLAPVNDFAYRAKPMPPKSLIPATDSIASSTTIQGSLLLFKIPRTSLDNRPLELTVKSPGVPEKTGTVDLDV